MLIHKEHGGDPLAEPLLHLIQDRLVQTREVFDATYRELMLALARHNIFVINENQISPRNQSCVITSYSIHYTKLYE